MIESTVIRLRKFAHDHPGRFWALWVLTLLIIVVGPELIGSLAK